MIARIVKTFKAFQMDEKYAYRATFEEIKENEFNLNISRNVHTFKDEKPVDFKQVKEIDELEKGAWVASNILCKRSSVV